MCTYLPYTYIYVILVYVAISCCFFFIVCCLYCCFDCKQFPFCAVKLYNRNVQYFLEIVYSYVTYNTIWPNVVLYCSFCACLFVCIVNLRHAACTTIILYKIKHIYFMGQLRIEYVTFTTWTLTYMYYQSQDNRGVVHILAKKKTIWKIYDGNLYELNFANTHLKERKKWKKIAFKCNISE